MMNQRNSLVGVPIEQPSRERLIPVQLGIMERIVTELEDEFGNLQDRLRTVRTEEVAGTQQEPKDPGLPCEIAEYLRVHNARIQKVVERIRYQLSVLEI